ncbi:hypothetical protein [Actinomadura rupiterrae]|uniref:hypothetical protein n=1 Tax=Actinomadura rupiterrae TaxID=559627 RepID=UPI0020A57343|nr:hypothetical protein [Actinomadura rupiterrae]MCP2335248.1 putative nucleic acid-binding protein [Actinomadura rupiterrae]
MRILLDACVALNLEATGEFDAISHALGVMFAMPAKAAEEVLYLIDLVDGEKTKTLINLSSHVEKETLELLLLSPGAETATFVDLATKVEDGEAQCLALAKHRRLAFATDDHAALKAAARIGLPAATSTPRLLRNYVDQAGLSQQETGLMLLAVESRARFRPPPGHADFAWWTTRRP